VHMSPKMRATCYGLWKGKKKFKLHEIQKVVKKKDGSKPTLPGIYYAATRFTAPSKRMGRPVGSTKTTAAQDCKIVSVMKELRKKTGGNGYHAVWRALPAALRRKVSPDLVRNHLRDRGYNYEDKVEHVEATRPQQKVRMQFGRRYASLTGEDWCDHLQGAGDLKDFTYYPPKLAPRFRKYRSKKAIMSRSERKKKMFVRPKRWFSRKEYNLTKKVKVFMCISPSGDTFSTCVTRPFTGEAFATMVRTQFGPWLRRVYGRRDQYLVLLDGEKVFGAPAAKRALSDNKIKLMRPWPPHSPDLNPIENAWALTEKSVRENAPAAESLVMYSNRVLRVSRKIGRLHGPTLIQSMERRCQAILKNGGKRTKY